MILSPICLLSVSLIQEVSPFQQRALQPERRAWRVQLVRTLEWPRCQDGASQILKVSKAPWPLPKVALVPGAGSNFAEPLGLVHLRRLVKQRCFLDLSRPTDVLLIQNVSRSVTARMCFPCPAWPLSTRPSRPTIRSTSFSARTVRE